MESTLDEPSSRRRLDGSVTEARVRARESGRPALLPRAAKVLALFGIEPRADDPRLRALNDATMRSDELGDAVAQYILRTPHGLGRRQFEQALEHGVDSLTEPCPELRALFTQLDSSPPWLDHARVRAGAEAMLRQGAEGLCALSAVSLMGGYLSSNATKPLAATGALARMAPRRLAETTQFVHAIATSGELGRASNGFKTTARVRIMHALVRAQLSASRDWRTESWGVPINQRDMVATHLTFTIMFIAGVSTLGRIVSADEREAIMHLWRYVSFVLGTSDALLPKTFREAAELGALFNANEPGPDHDGKALAKALVEAWGFKVAGAPLAHRTFGAFMVGFSRYALGPEAAQRLELPDTGWKYVPPVLALVRFVSELTGLVRPAYRRRGVRAGRKFIDRHLALTMAGKPARYVATHEAPA